MNEINRERAILDYTSPLTYSMMMEYLQIFCERYDFISVVNIGKSLCGKSIPLVTLGDVHAQKSVLYVGTHHAMEWICSVVLLRFINEYCECIKNGSRMYNLNMKYLFSSRRIMIVPMLNPDGVDLHIAGMWEHFPLRERVLAMNGGSDNFETWQSNARGVDLNHNYNALFKEYKTLERERNILPGPGKYSGEYPESEPETGALCSLLRFDDSIKLLLTFHSQGEEIFYGGDAAPNKSKALGKTISKMCSYKLSETEDTASYGGLTDWYVREIGNPAFTLECGRGKNPLPLSDYFRIYIGLRELLFSACTLI